MKREGFLLPAGKVNAKDEESLMDKIYGQN